MDKQILIENAEKKLQALRAAPTTRWIENDIRAWEHILRELKGNKQ